MDYSVFEVVRVNAESFPVTSFEQEKYDLHGITPVCCEVGSAEQLSEVVRDADAVMVVSQSLPTAAVHAMQCCRVICRLGAGTDRIDVKAATERGIVVANVPDFCVEEQADHSFALLLAVARRLNEMRICMLQGKYRDGRQQSRPLRRLSGRTLGLVGFGRSAQAMARRAAGFGMRVLATRRNMSAVDPATDSLNVELVAFETLLAESDFVSLHLPLNDQTHHLLDRDALGKMKAGSVLINTARGGIVDEDSLADFLETGHLAGAGLDTFAVVDVHESPAVPPTHRLFEMDNVVFTPHVAAFSVDSSREVGYGSVANLVAVLSGCWPSAERVVNSDVRPKQSLKR
jgi:D-3-phosphoglycerate dehydrogenase / 2-oxoglutarate reductase